MISRELAKSIQLKFEETSKVFGDFQRKTNLNCPQGCGKCCFKPDICCAPYELLPMALHLLDNGNAESMLERARENINQRCLFLNVSNEQKGMASCTEYKHRPFICRAFGLSARHGKRGNEISVCPTLKSSEDFNSENSFSEDDIPFIEVWKKRLESLDPSLHEKEIPINEALAIILEKVLLWDSLQRKSTSL